MKPTYKDLARKCVEKPERPTYYIFDLEKVSSSNGPSFLDALQPGQDVVLNCSYDEMRHYAAYMLDLNNPYTYTEPLKCHSRQINIYNIQAIERTENGICIFTPDAVYSTIPFYKEYESAQRQFDNYRAEVARMNRIRHIIEDSKTFFKKDFKAFCDDYQIKYEKKGLIGSKELDEISDRMIKKLESMGIDYKTAQSAPLEAFDAIIAEGQALCEERKRREELADARKLLNKLLVLEKPLVCIESMELWIKKNGLEEKDLLSGKFNNIVTDIRGDISPLEHEIPEDQSYVKLHGMTAKDVINLSDNMYALVTDSAIFIYTPNKEKMSDLRETYQLYLKEQGKDPTPFSGKMGVQYLMAAHNGYGDYLNEIRALKGTPQSIQKQMVSWLAKTSPNGDNLYYSSSDIVKVIDDNGLDYQANVRDLVPGMKIYVPCDQVKSIGETKFGTTPELLTVIDCDAHTQIPIIVTDKGILMTKDLSREIALEQGRNQENDSHNHAQEVRGNR